MNTRRVCLQKRAVLMVCVRIAVFSVKVLKDERIVVIAEQRPDCAEEEVCS